MAVRNISRDCGKHEVIKGSARIPVVACLTDRWGSNGGQENPPVWWEMVLQGHWKRLTAYLSLVLPQAWHS